MYTCVNCLQILSIFCIKNIFAFVLSGVSQTVRYRCLDSCEGIMNSYTVFCKCRAVNPFLAKTFRVSDLPENL